ncbi:MAG: glycosyltransferase [Pseudomonadota bacterium]
MTADNRRSLLFVLTSLRAGGTERQAAAIMNAVAADTTLRVSLLLLDGVSSDAYPISETIERVPNPHGGVRGALLSAGWLWRQGHRFDRIVSFLDIANLLTAMTVPRERLVWNLRTAGTPAKPRSRLMFRAARALSSTIPLAIANANAVRDFYVAEGFGCRAIDVLPNAVDTERFQPDEALRQSARERLGIGGDQLLLGLIGRDHPVKRHDLAFAALARLPRAQLLCIGDRVSNAGRLRELANQHGVSDRVRLLPPMATLEYLLPAVDIGLCVSDREGMPNSLLELMACGVPCIGTRVGGIPELLHEIGCVIEPGSTEALLSALETLSDAGLRTRMGTEARQRIVADFSQAVVLHRWRQVLVPAAR